MEVKLFTRDGGFVADIVTLPFQLMPEVILWGERFFMRNVSFDSGQGYGYTEAFCYAYVPIEGAV